MSLKYMMEVLSSSICPGRKQIAVRPPSESLHLPPSFKARLCFVFFFPRIAHVCISKGFQRTFLELGACSWTDARKKPVVSEIFPDTPVQGPTEGLKSPALWGGI